ncbi:hypothetical protein ACLQ2O_18265 [Kribbella sp. DT2]
MAGDSPATAAGSVADKAAAPDVQHHKLVFLSAADEENHGDGLLVVCVSVLIAITLTATIALVRRLWILPSSETPPAPDLVASSPGSRVRPAPGLFGIARI